MKLITTSWDDGHPLDFKIAELLDKYSINGTFYIPRSNPENEVMRENDLCELARTFEIGGHTLNHTFLRKNAGDVYEYEIAGSFNWLKDLLGKSPESFCFPGGHYNSLVIKTAKQAGYKFFRTVELLSIDNRSSLLPTSLQLFEHNRFTYLKHLVKRKKVENFIQWLGSGTESDLLKLTDYYLNKIEEKSSGCFHLWGHSWEIEQFGLWKKLEEVLKHLAERKDFKFVSNKDLQTLIFPKAELKRTEVLSNNFS